MPSPKPKAAETLACNDDRIQIEGNDSNQYTAIATGCGKKDVLYPDNRQWASLRERAAHEMSCSPGDLEVTVVEADTFSVAGCGKKTVYKWNSHYKMVVDSVAAPAPAAAAPVASTDAPAPDAPPAESAAAASSTAP